MTSVMYDIIKRSCIAMSAEWVTRGSHQSYRGDTYWSTFKTMNTQNLNLRKRERRVCVEWSNKRKICFPNNRLPRKEMCQLHQFTSITTLKHHLFMSLPYNIYHHHWGDCCCDLDLWILLLKPRVERRVTPWGRKRQRHCILGPTLKQTRTYHLFYSSREDNFQNELNET